MSSSYLEGSIAPFNKAIISLWFRAPAEVLNRLMPVEETGSIPEFHRAGALPLFTFGKIARTYLSLIEGQGSGNYTVTSYVTPTGQCDWTVSHQDTFPYTPASIQVEGLDLGEIGPSYLGICKDFEGGGFHLVLYLQTDSAGEGSGFGQNNTFTISSYGKGNATGEHLACNVETHYEYLVHEFQTKSVAPNGHRFVTVTGSDDGGVRLRGLGPDAFTTLDNISVQPDTWHHLLISFDVSHKSNSVSTTGTSNSGDYGFSNSTTPGSFSNPCKIWAALDDVNYARPGLTNIILNPEVGTLGPNEFMSRNTYIAAISQIGIFSQDAAWGVDGQWDDGHFSAVPITFTASGGLLPTDHFGIPTSSNTQDQMHHVEMAEFQMWTGKILDTSTESNRRVFIDYDKNSRTRVLKPVDPKQAEDLLGKPNILLHGSSKWIKGKNTGMGGDLDPTGEIKKYKPDPSISSPS